MRVTPEELEGLAKENEAWHNQRGEHPTAYLSDDLFDRIMADLHSLRAIEVGQQNMFGEDGA